MDVGDNDIPQFYLILLLGGLILVSVIGGLLVQLPSDYLFSKLRTSPVVTQSPLRHLFPPLPDIVDVEFTFVSEIPGYEIEPDSVNLDRLAFLLEKLKLVPLEIKPGFIISNEQPLNLTPKRVVVVFHAISEFDADADRDPLLLTRRFYTITGDGKPILQYLRGEIRDGQQITLPVYLDISSAERYQEPPDLFLSETALAALFFNFQPGPLELLGNPNEIFDKHVGRADLTLFKLKSRRSFTRLLSSLQIVSPVLAQQTICGTGQCGVLENPLGACTGPYGGISCQRNRQCPPGSTCVLPPAQCNPGGGGYICVSSPVGCVVVGSQCNSSGCVYSACSSGSSPYCGDGACNGSESCGTCEADCGPCPATCGDGTCDAGETCSNCSADCGACPPPPPPPPPPTGTVQGIIFDTDSGGSCSATTPGIPGVNLTINQFGGGGVCATVNTDASGSYSASCNAPGTYGVTINSAGSFLTTPALFCDGSAVTVAAGGSGTLRFGLTVSEDAWLQTEGSGDVYAGGSIDNGIPASCSGGCDPNFASVTGGEDPGLVIYGGASIDFGSGAVSSQGWVANSSYDGKRYGYQFYFNQLGFSSDTPSDFTLSQRNSLAKPASLPDRAYLARGNVTISPDPWVVGAGETIVILVDGDLNILEEISVAEGGFLAFFASGDIAIDPTVNSEDLLPALEGVYVADGILSTGAASTKLILEGTYVGWTGVLLERDFGSSRNNTEPVEVFRYRPDLVANIPRFLLRPRIEWEEVAP